MGWPYVPPLKKRSWILFDFLLALFLAAVTLPQDMWAQSIIVTLSRPHTEVAQEVERTVQLQADAVNSGEWASFKEQLWKGDPLYIQERKRWFEDAVSNIIPGLFK